MENENSFELVVIGSSSAGNAYLMKIEGEVILVECGFPYKKLIKETLYTPIKLEEAKACLITHGHKDHALAIKEINKMMPTFASMPTLQDSLKIIKANQILHALEAKQITSKIKIFPFEVVHDFPQSLGFIIVSETTKVLFINDCSKILVNLENWSFDYIFIECNYVDQLLHIQLNKAVQDGNRIIFKQLDRVHKVHLGLAGTLKILKSMKLDKTKAIFLMHLSDRNANVKMIKERCDTELPGKRVFICRKNGGLE